MSALRALAVDDETVSRLVVSRMLTNLGIEVTEADDVPAATEILRTGSFDLVVSDYNMPSGTGLELARQAKARGIPFILLTGFSYEDDFESDPHLVPVHLTKPVSSADLALAVESCGVYQPQDPNSDSSADSDPSSSMLFDRELALFEAIGVEVTLVDAEGNILGSTSATSRALGYSEDFWAELNIVDLIHPEDRPSARNVLSSILTAPGRSAQVRVRGKRADEQWENIEVYATNLLDDPDVQALVLTTRSVTIEERLRAAHNESMQRTASQVEYVASVSHELRSPLQGILGVAQLLDGHVSGEASNLVDIISSEAERLRRVIDDILDYAKSDQGAMELDPRPTSIHRVIAEVFDICATQANPGVRLVTEIEPDVPDWVQVDDLRLHQVLINLVANATRFTDSGSIAVSCQRLPQDRLLMVVKDTGAGIAPDKLQGLFEPFRQGQRSSDGGGTGLGLTIAKNLIGLMGGRLDVESLVGAGSTFSFAIKAPEAEQEQVPGSPPTPAASNSPSSNSLSNTEPAGEEKPRALVVDDGEVNRMVISRQLELMGFAVDTAEGGEQGTEMILSNNYRVVVTDWHMPEVDGLELIRRVRQAQTDGPAQTPIVTVTASAMAADRERCLNAGADDFLAKPATKAELFEVVGRYLEQEPEDQKPEPEADGGWTENEALEVAVLVDLGQQLGDQTALGSVVRAYVSELDRLGAAITAAIAAGDPAAAGDAAHTLKAPSLMLGAVKLGEVCRGLEDRSIDIGDVDVATFERNVQTTSDAVTRWLCATDQNTITEAHVMKGANQ